MGRFKNISSFYKKNKSSAKQSFKKLYRVMIYKFEKRPIVTTLVLLGALLLLIILGNILRTPSQEDKSDEKIVKSIEVYDIGDETAITIQGQIEKSGIVTIVAQTAGIISNIHVTAGDEIKVGGKLIDLSSNYSGASAPSVQRQIAGVQYQNTKQTYDTQKEIVSKQKELTNKQDENADELREISDESIDRTEDLIDLNEEILSSINSNLEELEESNTDGANDDAILSTQQLKSQIQSTLNQLETSLDTTRYQSSGDNPQAEISDLTREITLKQLDIQEKALDLSLKTAGLQLQLAQIQESLMFPKSPINATVERIFVKEGESVNPGTPLLVLHGDQKLQLLAKVPYDIAQLISPNKPSIIKIQDNEIKIAPTHVSIDVTDGNLSTVLFSIPDSYQNKIANNSFVPVSLSIDKLSTLESIYVPIDAIHNLSDAVIVYVVQDNIAKALRVDLKNLRGSFAEIENPELSNYEKVILNRNISEGDLVSF